jgi:hypothetical protein
MPYNETLYERYNAMITVIAAYIARLITPLFPKQKNTDILTPVVPSNHKIVADNDEIITYLPKHGIDTTTK